MHSNIIPPEPGDASPVWFLWRMVRTDVKVKIKVKVNFRLGGIGRAALSCKECTMTVHK